MFLIKWLGCLLQLFYVLTCFCYLLLCVCARLRNCLFAHVLLCYSLVPRVCLCWGVCLHTFCCFTSWSWIFSFPFLTGCRWEITAYFHSLPQVGTSKDSESWIPTNTQQWQQPPLITPIKSMNRDPLNLQLYLEHPSFSETKSQEEL